MRYVISSMSFLCIGAVKSLILIDQSEEKILLIDQSKNALKHFG